MRGLEEREEEEDWAVRVALRVVKEAVQEGWLHAGNMALVLLLAHARRGLREEAASLLHCLSRANIPVPGGALLDVLRAAAAHRQADFFVFLLREWVAADVTVLGGPWALEEVLQLLLRCRRPHQAVSWFRRCLGAHPHAPLSPAVVRVLLHALQRRSMWHEMLDVFGSLQHYPGYHDKVNYTTVIRTLLHCRQPKLALTLFRDMLTSGVLQCDTHGRVLTGRGNDATHERLLQAVRHAACLVGDREVLGMVGGAAMAAHSKTRRERFRPDPPPGVGDETDSSPMPSSPDGQSL
ncbi:unnamed protein product [Closterium sp. Naga37s-1]|nr:unnamed protein product [Closterium sp. Naga37s-1]